MRKTIFLGCLILFLAANVLLNCASIPIKLLSQSDLPELKGKWNGFYQDRGGTYIQPVELEIFNGDLNGKITFDHASRSPTSFPFNGKLEKGRIVYSWLEGQYIHLNFRKGEGKVKLEGNYRIQQWEGTIFLDKVK